MNQVALMGRLTRDPELRHTPSGTACASFTLAIDRAGDMKDGDPQVGFFDVTAWGRTAEVIDQYVAKGDQIGVYGELRHHRWEKDGQKRSKVEINARGFTFGAKKGGSDGERHDRQAPPPDADFPAPDDDDIPF